MNKTNIGIVTTWFERGAAYVSKQFEEVLSQKHDVFIYARGGEEYAKGDPNWDKENVWWGKRIASPFAHTIINKKDFTKWINYNSIHLVIFNEQQWWYPIIWCNELGVKTVGYIDYYKENTIRLFESYDGLICNTKRHYSVFKHLTNAFYIPWGTNLEVFKPNNIKLVNKEFITFFHSCGMSPHRKGTDLLIEAFSRIDDKFQLIIHTQVDLKESLPKIQHIIDELISKGSLTIINKTIGWPGLYYLGDVYVYPARLDGIGLTITEAMASGLAIITSDNPPMNEFIDNNGKGIKIEKLYARYDGYYWPMCEVNLDSLIKSINSFISDHAMVLTYKKNSAKLANQVFNWKENGYKLNVVVEKLIKKDIEAHNIDVKSSIIAYENSGVKKLNKYTIKFQWLYQLFKFFY